MNGTKKQHELSDHLLGIVAGIPVKVYDTSKVQYLLRQEADRKHYEPNTAMISDYMMIKFDMPYYKAYGGV